MSPYIYWKAFTKDRVQSDFAVYSRATMLTFRQYFIKINNIIKNSNTSIVCNKIFILFNNILKILIIFINIEQHFWNRIDKR